MYIYKYKKPWIVGLLGVLLLAGAPFGVGAAAGETLRVVGSTTVLPIASRAAERFMALTGGVRITVNAGGSGVGVNSVARGLADIGMVSRELSDDERRRFRNPRLLLWTVARDAVACVVSSEVYHRGVRALSRDQIADIYRGRLNNWKQVGGPDRPIVVIDKERHRGTRHVFMKYLFGDPIARAPAARLVTGSNNEEQAKIAQSDAAIGMLSFAWINDDVAGVGIRAGDRVIEPTRENIAAGTFPITRNLHFVTAGEPQGLAREFIDFVLGPQGRGIAEAAGYIPARPVESAPGPAP